MQQIRPWIGKPPIADPPIISGYRLIRSERIDLLRVSILGVLLAPIWWVMFGVVVGILSGQQEVSGSISVLNLLVGISFAVILVITHEVLHGVAILAGGKRPSFGAGPGFFYTTCHDPLTRRAYGIVLLFPLIVINGGALIAASIWPAVTGWVLFLSLLNTMGAGGDIWMFFRILKAPRTALIVDLASGFAIYDVDLPQATTASSLDS